MDTALFDYALPNELIAQTPLANRAASRLMTLDAGTGVIGHTVFSRLPDYLRPGDCLVFNDTKVIPARLIGHRPTGGRAELLLLERKTDTVWEALAKPGRHMRAGDTAVFGDELSAEIIDALPDGNRLARFTYDGVFEEILDRLGETPLPPYITEKLDDPARYQTVYAKYEGSAAAPTAGLHFTEELLAEIRAMGVHTAYITLHVGLGTFRPVKEADATRHAMHAERFVIPEAAAEAVNQTKANGGRVICVGTTSCRALETNARNGSLSPGGGKTEIFIYPGYPFQLTDALITNFHLPKSTLLMLVSALAGRENVLAAYAEAVRAEYRFFSFGDAMFIGRKISD